MNQENQYNNAEPAERNWFAPAEIFENVIYYRWIFTAIFAVVFLFGAVNILLKTPFYQADVLIQVEGQKSNAVGSILSGGGVGASDAFDLVSQSPVSGQIEIFKSRNVIGRAVESQFLHTSITVKNRPPFVGGFAGRYLPRDEEGVVIPPFNFVHYAWGGESLVFDRFVVPSQFQSRPLTLIVEESRNWTIRDQEDRVLVQGHNLEPVEADNGRWQVKIRSLKGYPGTEFNLIRYPLQSRIEQISGSLKVSERGRGTSLIEAKFDNPNPEFATSMMNALADAFVGQNIERKSEEAEKTLKFLNTLLPELKNKADVSAQSFAKYQESTRALEPKAEIEKLVAQSVDLENQRISLEIKLQEFSQRYAPAHPTIKAIDASLAELRSQYQDINDQIKALPEDQYEYFKMIQSVELDAKLYTSLVEYAQKLELTKAGTVGNVAIIDRAILPSAPAYPNKVKEISILGILSFALGVLGAHLFGMLLGNVRNPRQLEEITGAKILAVLPLANDQLNHDSNEPYLLAKDKPNAISVESLRSLRIALQFALIEKAQQKSILITSAVSGQGKSFIASNLAFLISATGKKTLLIDADIRKGTVFRYFPIKRKEIGLSEVLQEKIELSSVVLSQLYPNLDILPAGNQAPNPGELFIEGKFKQIIEWAGERYDSVIVDSPPVLPVNDALVLSRVCDLTAFVARQEKISLHEIEESFAMFSKASALPDGIVFNCFTAPRLRYGFRKYGYYAYQYGYSRYGAGAYEYGLEPETQSDLSNDGLPTTLKKIRSDGLNAAKRLSRVIQKRLTKIFARFRR